MSYQTADELDRLAADILALVPRLRAAAKALRKASPAAKRAKAKAARKAPAKRDRRQIALEELIAKSRRKPRKAKAAKARKGARTR